MARLSNDPTAEYDPAANWQMNAIATETLVRNCIDRDVERLVFAPSSSLYDGMREHARRERSDPDTRRVRDVQALRRGGPPVVVDNGLCPVILRNGTVYGYRPRMRSTRWSTPSSRRTAQAPALATRRRRLDVDELIPLQRDATAPLLREIEADLPFLYNAGSVLVNR